MTSHVYTFWCQKCKAINMSEDPEDAGWLRCCKCEHSRRMAYGEKRYVGKTDGWLAWMNKRGLRMDLSNE